MLVSTLFAADAPKAAPAKVYVVYVTVVEVDAEGNETVLFTPKVQTTGDPAGATIEHVDGRSFEFNCKMAASPEPPLERTPDTSAKKPFLLTVGSTERKSSKPGLGLDQPGFANRDVKAASKEKPAYQSLSRALHNAPAKMVSAAGSRRYENTPTEKHSPLLPSPLPHGGEGTKPKAAARPVGDYFVRTYDVSALLDEPANKPLTEDHFAPVIQTIKAFAEVETWDAPAAIKPFTSTKSLVVKQTAAGHDAVAETLESLKKTP
jgi:hypothetical protein